MMTDILMTLLNETSAVYVDNRILPVNYITHCSKLYYKQMT